MINKFFKAFLLAVVVAGTALTGYGAEKGEKVFGLRAGYVSRNNSADMGLFFQYTFSKYFRLQPAVDLVFRHNDRDAFTVDINGQVPIDFSTEKFDLYPMAGINFSSWNHHYYIMDPEKPEWKDYASSRSNYFGVNLGAGFGLKVSKTLKISLEAEYTFVKSNSGVRILAGVGYVF